MLNYHYDRKDTTNEGSLQTERSAQEVFEQVFSAELAKFAEIIQTAFALALEELGRRPLHYQTPSSKANHTIELIRGMLFDNFPDLMHAKGSRFYLEKGGYRIYFKKLKNMRPMNNHTRSSRRILNQLSLFPDFRLSEVFVGYELNKSKDNITGIFAVYFMQGSQAWVSPLNNLPSVEIVQAPVASTSNDADDDIVVRPKSRPGDSRAAM